MFTFPSAQARDERKAITMAASSALRPARATALLCAGLLATLAGCASVADDATTARTVAPASPETDLADGAPQAATEMAYAILPVAKPGTENTGAALPAPIAATADETGAIPVSALAEARSVTGAAAAASALAGNGGMNAAPTSFGVSAMETDFDGGEPVGLEQLVATHRIVPVTRPDAVALSTVTSQPRLAAEQPIRKSGTPIDGLIEKYAALYGIPESLLHRVVRRESTYNPRAYNNGHYGLMQIKYATAKSMGYDGPAEGLFDAETNIKYAGKYLRGAWLVADDKNDGAVRLYAAGYYYHAKRKGLLEETGLR